MNARVLNLFCRKYHEMIIFSSLIFILLLISGCFISPPVYLRNYSLIENENTEGKSLVFIVLEDVDLAPLAKNCPPVISLRGKEGISYIHRVPEELQSRVENRDVRYYFLVDPGEYLVEIPVRGFRPVHFYRTHYFLVKPNTAIFLGRYSKYPTSTDEFEEKTEDLKEFNNLAEHFGKSEKIYVRWEYTSK